MPSLKDFRNRIDTVKSTRKITKAMQMVAAAKLRRAQEAAEAAQPYAGRMAAVVANLAASMTGRPDTPLLLGGRDKDDVHLLVVATADRGLCGGFNTNIVRAARERIVALEREGKTVKIVCVGRKGQDQLKRLYADRIVDTISLRDVKTLSSREASMIAEKARELYEGGEVDAVSIVFSEFRNVISQVPVVKTLLPALNSVDADAEGPDLQGAAYEYEPDEEEILEVLLPRYVTTQIFNALLQNAAGEQGARMSAMDNATRNAGELIDSLTLQYNRARQANITKELIEIISGAEAL